MFCNLLTSCQPDLNPKHNNKNWDYVQKTYDSLYTVNADSGYQYLTQSFKNINQAGARAQVVYYNRLAAYFYDVKKEFEKSSLYADSAIQQIQEEDCLSDFSIECFWAYVRKAQAEAALERYREAILFLSKAKSLFESSGLNNPCDIWVYYHTLAHIYYKQSNWSKSRENFHSLLQLADTCMTGFKRFWAKQENLNNIALSYRYLGKPDSATFNYEAALNLLNKEGVVFAPQKKEIENAKLLVYNNLAEMYYSLGKISNAKQILLKGLEMSVEKDKAFEIDFRLQLFYPYYKEGEAAKIKANLERLEKITDTSKYDVQAGKFYYQRSQYYSMVKDSGKALIAYKRYHQIKDSFNRRTSALASIDLGKEFRYRERQLEAESLKKDNEIKRIYIWLIGLIASLAIGAVAVVIFNLLRSNKHIHALKKLNIFINEQNVEMQDTLVLLEQVDSEKDRIMKVLAHDLKVPIGGIRILTYSLIKSEESAERKAIMKLIFETCQNSLSMISEILHEDNNRESFEKSRVDLVDLIQYSVDLMQVRADEKKQKLIFKYEAVSAYIHRQQIWRLVSNLISNAIKFSSHRSSIYITLARDERNVIISVEDQGIGVPPQLQKSLFSEHKRVSRVGTDGEESNGIGLSICRKIVEAHKGKIWVDSAQGFGSTFYVRLPIDILNFDASAN